MVRNRKLVVLLAICAFFLASAPALPYALAQVEVTGEYVGASVILDVKNSGQSAVHTFSIFLDSGEFRSYKTGNDWSASINSAGILTFTASSPLEPGNTAQFGVKTTAEDLAISWNAFGADFQDAESGTVVGTERATADTKTPHDDDTAPSSGQTALVQNTGAITEGTEFRIVPERPHTGASIRILADGLIAGKTVDFYIGTHMVGTYTASKEGRILETARIPEGVLADRTDFVILDSQDNRKDLSIRLAQASARVDGSKIQSISISGPVDVKPSQIYEFGGSYSPSSHIVVVVQRSDGIILGSGVVLTDATGAWKYNVLVPAGMPTGAYTIQATNGRVSESRIFTVNDEKTIDVAPTRLKFEPGDLMVFEGMVQPDSLVDVSITDPRNREVYSEAVRPDSENMIRVEFQTRHSDLEGTYALFLSQDDETVVVLGGLGEFVTERITLHIDKINYRTSESVNVFIDGDPDSNIAVIVLDSANTKKLEEHVKIGSSGKLNYIIDLSKYVSGVYTLVVTKATAETETDFGVNIAYGSGLITVTATKSEYAPGSEVLVLGNIATTLPVLLDISLLDPDGNEVRTKQIFSLGSAGKGKISDNSFRIPSDAAIGEWTIRVQSGATNTATDKFSVVAAMNAGAQITASVLEDHIPRQLRIAGKNIPDVQRINLVISTTAGEVFGELEAQVTLGGNFEAYWQIPDGLHSGTYAVRINQSSSETTFTLK